jgi:hypothetical protein
MGVYDASYHGEHLQGYKAYSVPDVVPRANFEPESALTGHPLGPLSAPHDPSALPTQRLVSSRLRQATPSTRTNLLREATGVAWHALAGYRATPPAKRVGGLVARPRNRGRRGTAWHGSVSGRRARPGMQRQQTARSLPDRKETGKGSRRRPEQRDRVAARSGDLRRAQFLPVG